MYFVYNTCDKFLFGLSKWLNFLIYNCQLFWCTCLVQRFVFQLEMGTAVHSYSTIKCLYTAWDNFILSTADHIKLILCSRIWGLFRPVWNNAVFWGTITKQQSNSIQKWTVLCSDLIESLAASCRCFVTNTCSPLGLETLSHPQLVKRKLFSVYLQFTFISIS